jgi:2-oxoglutarate/2-oxoacid ferredoxin oxidoreductase subunit beta
MNTIVDNIVNAPNTSIEELTPKDFKVDIDVRWCAGCGGYSILSQVQRLLPELGIAKENFVFVSGIGCSSRFPYYIDTYGFHSIHGRALPIATGLKLTRPDLSIWVATGDGDCMSIGGNHFIHACRRNVDINIMMFNNQIYSLTKGQYSPTSQPGQITKSSPLGVLDNPFNPTELAMGAGATFVARALDSDPKHMQSMFERAHKHKGISFIEVYANCVIFNDNAFTSLRDKKTTKDVTVTLEHGKPVIFGENRDKAIKLDGFTPNIINLNDGVHSANDALIHNEKDSTLAFILSNMTYNTEMPRPLGVFQALDRPVYNEQLDAQIEFAKQKFGIGNVDDLLKGEDSWVIE